MEEPGVSSSSSEQPCSNSTGKRAFPTDESSSSDSEPPRAKILKTLDPRSQREQDINGFVDLTEAVQEIRKLQHHIIGPDMIKRLSAAAAAAEGSVKARWQSRYTPYSRVSVLLLSWVDDDLGVTKEICQLRSLFRDTFHYQVHEWELPSGRGAYVKTWNKIHNFTKNYGGEGTLIILYYGGHAYQDPTSAASGPIWSSYVLSRIVRLGIC